MFNLAGLTALTFAHLAQAADVPADAFSSIIPQRILATVQQLGSHAPEYPHVTNMENPKEWDWKELDWWTSGYFPASLYALNKRATLCNNNESMGLNDTDWLLEGQTASAGLLPLADGTVKNTNGHDQGFLSLAFVDELEIHPDNETASAVTLRFADILANRFVPGANVTRSWDPRDGKSEDDVTVIIDNMMNLDLLFVAANLTGNNTYIEIAEAHANTTMHNQFREDGSTWHVVEYNETTGAVISKHTSQGYSDDSTWSRGQGWALYGFANMYRRTNITDYLDTARRAATYFLEHTPGDFVVPWDFNAPEDEYIPADTSAAMVAANGLLLLAQHETNETLASTWIDGAINILGGTTQLAFQEDNTYASILSNGTWNKPQGSFDTGIVYGDYYFLTTGNTLIEMGLASCTNDTDEDGSGPGDNNSGPSNGASNPDDGGDGAMSISGSYIMALTSFVLVAASLSLMDI